ncbi:hypothetical protein [uncultured Mailhella sp.]|uniref:hypothetical protein n=1 Tax=uncultured Mailhella sp. TaxID=1981031 RepID=UPI00260E142F|nr:hypothetical protein [uncultured Mailhella sp.]
MGWHINFDDCGSLMAYAGYFGDDWPTFDPFPEEKNSENEYEEEDDDEEEEEEDGGGEARG